MSDDNPFELGTIDSGDPARLQPQLSTVIPIDHSPSSREQEGNVGANPFTPTITLSEMGDPLPDAGERSDQQSSGLKPTVDLVRKLLTRAAEPSENPAPEQQSAVRSLTFWRNGFQLQDGELRRYDDPLQIKILQEINEGSAPASELDVLPGQLVELRVMKRANEDYVPPKVAAPSTTAVKQPQGTKLPNITSPPKGTKPQRSGRIGNDKSGSKWSAQSILQSIGCSCF